MIVTDDDRLADLCRSMRNQGRALTTQGVPSAGGAPAGSWLHHERLGYNYRMPEINAALGVAQMRRLDSILERRQNVARQYINRLADSKHLIVPSIDSQTVMSWFVFVVRLATSYTVEERDRIIRGLRNHEVGAADYFPCIHLQPFYREQFGFGPGVFPIAESVSQRTIALPFYNDLSPRDIELVCQTVDVMIGRENLTRG